GHFRVVLDDEQSHGSSVAIGGERNVRAALTAISPDPPTLATQVSIEPNQGGDMSNRLTKIGAALAAVAALAVGGSAIAGAAQKGAPPKPAVSQSQEPLAPDTDNVQQGDQSAPDTASASASEQASESASESAGESASESSASDGPGGYADSNANAD